MNNIFSRRNRKHNNPLFHFLTFPTFTPSFFHTQKEYRLNYDCINIEISVTWQKSPFFIRKFNKGKKTRPLKSSVHRIIATALINFPRGDKCSVPPCSWFQNICQASTPVWNRKFPTRDSLEHHATWSKNIQTLRVGCCYCQTWIITRVTIQFPSSIYRKAKPFPEILASQIFAMVQSFANEFPR